MEKICSYCLNATVDSDLTSDNDLSYIPVGCCKEPYSIFMKTGNGGPTVILFEDRNIQTPSRLAARFYPRFCPFCGRELIENEIVFNSRRYREWWALQKNCFSKSSGKEPDKNKNENKE